MCAACGCKCKKGAPVKGCKCSCATCKSAAKKTAPAKKK